MPPVVSGSWGLYSKYLRLAAAQLANTQSRQNGGLFGVSRRVQWIKSYTQVMVAGPSITTPSDHTKSLGVRTDTSLTFDKHRRNICKTSYFHIRGSRQVQGTMDQSIANAVTCANVSSRLDYCNALLAGMSWSNLDKLQRIQNFLDCDRRMPSKSHQTSS